MAQDIALDEPEIPFDEPALALSDGDEDDPLQAAINSVTKDDRPPAKPRDVDNRSLRFSKDITGESTCTGEFKDFDAYFHDRYERLSSILETRNFDATIRKISSLERMGRRSKDVDIVLIGLVYDKWTSKNGHQMLQIDDDTGSMRVVFTDEEIKDKCIEVVEDEIVAVKGQVSDDGDIVFGDEIYFPDVPASNRQNTADRSVKAALISDVHFGSKDFAATEWNRFVDWIRQQPDIEYLLVSGDLVEGVGVYPGQKEELVVTDIKDQYKVAAEAFKELPDDLDIVCSVGNHDSVRLAEPQPTLPDKFTEMFPRNVEFVGNPVQVDVEGVSFLLYHGMSLNPLLEVLPGQDIHEPAGMMKPLLKKRHLVPMWGNGVRVAPEERDYLAIDDIPDYLHCGHVHTYEVDEYNGVSLVNSGCWQERTDFQRSKNVFPDVANVAVADLQTGEVDTFSF